MRNKKNSRKCKKNVKTKINTSKLEINMDCPISPPPTRSSPATPSQNQMQGKSINQEDDSSLNNRNLPGTFSPASRDVECERLESNSMDIENGNNKHNIGMETACVGMIDTLAKTFENPQLIKLTKSLSTDDPCCYSTPDDDNVKNGPHVIAKVLHENPRQEFPLPTATNWDVSINEVIDERTKLEPTTPVSDYFNKNFDSSDESDAFKAETASIFQPDEENTTLTPIDIQSNTTVAKETDSNATDKPSSFTEIPFDWPNNEFIAPPVATGIDTTEDQKYYEEAHNLDLDRNINIEDNSFGPSSISVDSDQGFDTLSDTQTTEPDTPTHLGHENEKKYAKKFQEKIKADLTNIAEMNRNVSSKNSLQNVEEEEKSCGITTSFNYDAKFDPKEKSREGQVSDILMSKQISNEENEFKDEIDQELSEIITEAKTKNRMGPEPDDCTSLPSTSEATRFIEIHMEKKNSAHDTDKTETLSENDHVLQEEKAPYIGFKDFSKTVGEVSIVPSSISIPVVSLKESIQKNIIEENHTRDIEHNEEIKSRSNFDSNINNPNRSLSHLMHGLPTQTHIYEMGLSKDLIKLQESIKSKEIPLADSSHNQSSVVPRILTESILEHSVIGPEYITPSILQEDMASYLKASNISEVQEETHGNIQQIPSNLNTPTFETNFYDESDLKSKKKNADYVMRTRENEEKEAYTAEQDMNSNIHNIFRQTDGEQALAPELVIISKETLNHLHKKTALMQAEILRLSTALKTQKNVSESEPISKNTPTQSTQQNSELLENDEIFATQLPKLAKIQSCPRTKRLWENLWPFGRRDTENSTTLSSQQVTRKGYPFPLASIGESTESVTHKEVKRYKVIGRVRAKDFPEDCVY